MAGKFDRERFWEELMVAAAAGDTEEATSLSKQLDFASGAHSTKYGIISVEAHDCHVIVIIPILSDI